MHNHLSRDHRLFKVHEMATLLMNGVIRRIHVRDLMHILEDEIRRIRHYERHQMVWERKAA